MNPSRDDSAGARENPDETVWPPPPTGPGVVTRPRPRLLFVLSVPEVLAEFRLPPWAKSAWNYLAVAFAIAWIYTKSPVLAKVLLGLILYVLSWPFFGLLFTLGLEVYFLAASAVIGPNYSRWHTTSLAEELAGEMRLFADTYSSPLPVAAVMRRVGLRAAGRLMFFVWGFSFLLSSHRPLITWIALIFWVCLLVVGIGVAVVNRVQQWLLSKDESGS